MASFGRMRRRIRRTSWAVAQLKSNKIPAHVKARAAGRWAEIIFRALSSRVADRWRFVSFRGANKSEWRGVVDLVAIRKNSRQPSNVLLKRGDLLVLVIGGECRQKAGRIMPVVVRQNGPTECANMI